MTKSGLEQYRVSDFVEWHRTKRLKLNPEFQRRSVWTNQARVLLIDTILRDLPMPKLYLRTFVDPATRQSVREVVDGQQRLRAIIEFADDKLVLSKRAGEFAGLRYGTLSTDLQERFLMYPLSVDQLFNASDDHVLEVFARLNSYNVTLNSAEKRHAQFQGNFKWAVRSKAQRWGHLMDSLGVFSIRQRVRMSDDSFIADCLNILLHGVRDGGESAINRLYRQLDHTFPEDDASLEILDESMAFIEEHLASEIADTPIARPPHFLMLVSALAHGLAGIPQGQLAEPVERREAVVLQDLDTVRANLTTLASVIDSDEPPVGFEQFWTAAQGSTHRLASRGVRFPVTYQALLPKPIVE